MGILTADKAERKKKRKSVKILTSKMRLSKKKKKRELGFFRFSRDIIESEYIYWYIVYTYIK